jgi:hypothetical protein
VGLVNDTEFKKPLGFKWVDGNPHNLGASDTDWGLYLCPAAENRNADKENTKIGNKGSEYYFSTYAKVMFFISATP